MPCSPQSRKSRHVRILVFFICIFCVINCVIFMSLRHDTRSHGGIVGSLLPQASTSKPSRTEREKASRSLSGSIGGPLLPRESTSKSSRTEVKKTSRSLLLQNPSPKPSGKLAKKTSSRLKVQPKAKDMAMAEMSSISCSPAPRPLPPRHQLMPCSWRTANSSCSHRLQTVFQCNSSSVSVFEKRVGMDTPPVSVSFNDTCLLRVVRGRCSEAGRPVPRVVHYIQFSRPGTKGRELPIYTFLGLVSVVRFLQPCLLLFHADYLPYGPLWKALLRMTSRVVHVRRTAPNTVFGHVIEKIEHKADVARLEALIKFGGIYIDSDEVILQPMDDLMKHHVTMAWEKPNKSFGNGLFLAEADHPFLKLWYDKYRKFSNRWWAYFSTTVPRQLYQQNPKLGLHVVDTFFRPNLWNITQMLYENRYDWSNHYALHLYYRRNQKYFRGFFEKQNTTLGEISRHILFGDPQRCFV